MRRGALDEALEIGGGLDGRPRGHGADLLEVSGSLRSICSAPNEASAKAVRSGVSVS
jgi:hypothetical protein